jgi:hypothetical protein
MNRNERRTPERDLADKALEVFNRLERVQRIADENDSSRIDEITELKRERAYFFIDQEMDDIMNEAEAVHQELKKQRASTGSYPEEN